ncbi:MAG: hypothetical protein DRN30_04050 [Thermoplasmata archaeon]|nr:hypothetical protein [Euryarchaeota archaeon]RLF65386.1 MAG: hypothetical protein DRN30_04050 [Thermoplasmata archaeon]
MEAWHIPIAIFLGYLLSKWINKVKTIVRIATIDIALPAYMFFVAYSGIKLDDMYAFVFGILASILGILSAGIIFKGSKLKKEAMIMSSLGNCVIFGFPIILSLGLPEKIAVVYVQGHNLIALTLIPFIVTENIKNLSRGFYNAIRTPLIIGFLLGLIFSPWDGLRNVSGVIKHYLSYSFYILLLYLGSNLKKGAFDKRFTIGVFLSKIIIPTLIVYPLVIFFSREIMMTTLVLTAAPPAILTNAIISKYGLREDISAFTTLVLTLIAMIPYLALSF